MRVLSILLATLLATTAWAQDAGDADRGAKVFKKCKACHKVGADAKNGVGPHLNSVFGRTAGGLEGYGYSKSMIAAGTDGLVWTQDTMDAFLKKPKAVVPKTKMSFKGLKKDKDRANLLAYLRRFSQDTANSAAPTEQAIVAPEVLAIKGDAEYGEYLSSDCMTCHQASGGDDGIPNIIGWPEEDFALAMHAYKQKLRPHPVMQMMAGRLSNEEIAALAAYFKSLTEG